MKAAQFTGGKWLRSSDIEQDTTVTIKDATRETLDGDDGPEKKLALHFEGDLAPLILNKTNITRLADLLGPDTDDWVGKKVVLWVDDNVTYGSKTVSGLRIKALKVAKRPVNPDADDSAPF